MPDIFLAIIPKKSDILVAIIPQKIPHIIIASLMRAITSISETMGDKATRKSQRLGVGGGASTILNLS